MKTNLFFQGTEIALEIPSMKTNLTKSILASLTLLMAVACTKTVTTNAPSTSPSTPSVPSTAEATPKGGSREILEANTSTSGGGGVINGGGGKGVRCQTQTGDRVELLDLREAQKLYKLQIENFGSTKEEALMTLSRKLAKHFQDSYVQDVEQQAKSYYQHFLELLEKKIQFTEPGKHLKDVPDSFEPLKEESCFYVQVAHFYDESVVLIDKDYWDLMDWNHRTALIAHEWFYLYARQNGANNSVQVRKMVGTLFSTKGLQPMMLDPRRGPTPSLDISCEMNREGFRTGAFVMRPARKEDQQQGHDGMDVMFVGLENEKVLVKTFAHLENLKPNRFLQNTSIQTSPVSVQKDTYDENESSVIFNFEPMNDKYEARVGGKGMYLNGSVRFYTKRQEVASIKEYKFSCVYSSKVFQVDNWFQPYVRTKDQVFVRESKDEWNNPILSMLQLRKDGLLMLDIPMSVEIEGVSVICPIREAGSIIEETEESVTYSVKSYELGQSMDNTTPTCNEYIHQKNVSIRKAGSSSKGMVMKKIFTQEADTSQLPQN